MALFRQEAGLYSRAPEKLVWQKTKVSNINGCFFYIYIISPENVLQQLKWNLSSKSVISARSFYWKKNKLTQKIGFLELFISSTILALGYRFLKSNKNTQKAVKGTHLHELFHGSKISEKNLLQKGWSFSLQGTMRTANSNCFANISLIHTKILRHSCSS